ncbi:M56 family metallopeptidase [Streptomyces sp. 7-21]|uniref:M56 family metallopeptidase n=1 Tax=Streptomyces sp. 7-21 TaxID=2802283 RepID=UPI00191FB7E6|nr:M56 family metallopeptidase [Streptomyces sp. 7-21]MBL1066888.1 M56 family metallopeptidase [Streptomyces sp. 7-21]
MGVFVFLPLVLPLTAWPIARLAGQHLHPRAATRLLTAVAAVLALCATLCVALLVIVGTAQVPGNPLPDGWSDPQVRAAVPFDGVAGWLAIPALLAAAAACGQALWRHWRVGRAARRALAGLGPSPVAVLPDDEAYAYALPAAAGHARGRRRGGGRDRIVVSTALLRRLTSGERRALFAHERAHLTGRHHRCLLVVELAARAHPLLRPLRTAVAYSAERWADEHAARVVGSRRVVARAVGKAALVARGGPGAPLLALAGPGPVPRRVAALLGPPPPSRRWPPALTRAGLAAWAAAGGAAASALSSLNAAAALSVILRTAAAS